MQNQGIELLNQKQKYIKLIPDSLMEKNGLIDENHEGFGLKDAMEADKQALEDLENKFNRVLNLYSSNYKLYLNDLLTRNSNGGSNLKNKIVNYNGKKHYINGMGIIRTFSDTAWNSKSSSCNDPTSTISKNDYDQLSQGAPMGIGELCKNGGYNAIDRGSSSVAWIDQYGYKHIYEDPLDRHSSCSKTSKGNDVEISTIAFNAMPQGRTFDKNDECKLNLDDNNRYNYIVRLNQSLINIVNQMHGKIKKMKSKDKTINSDVKKARTRLVSLNKQLTEERKKLELEKGVSGSMDSKARQRTLEVESINFKKTLWLLTGVTFVIAIYRQLK